MSKPEVRQLFYISDSLIGDDQRALDDLLHDAQHKNVLWGITGLLWTDGDRFAQILEGEEAAVGHLFIRIAEDKRHTNVVLFDSGLVFERHFGSWSMARPEANGLTEVYEDRARRRLRGLETAPAQAFLDIMG